ncbi:uncharacterized protein LOC143547248 [Bidens hawaiensis]|uniref:uncharacterized protein LOC143547248 n=1 Tax=Bidens hawaiensis TaxID=980011 RepID=UPI00404A8482
MLNHSQLMPVVSQSQQSQQANWMWQPPPHVNNNNNRKVNRGIDNRNTTTNNNRKEVAAYKDLQKQNRVKPKQYISKKRFNNGGKFAPRNTTSFLIRAKKAGGIAPLVSPCPVTPAVLNTPVFSPSREVLIDMAKEEWGVDGYGSMNGLIRVRSPDNDEKSDVEDCSAVERRLDHDFSRFEMISISPNYGVSDSTNNNNNGCLLENRVDDQDTHIAKLEEKNLLLKNRLLLMEKEFDKLRTRLQCLEMRGLGAKVAKNDSENEESSKLLEEDKNSVDNKESDNGDNGLQGSDNIRKIEANKIEDEDHVNGIAANADSCVNQ